MSRCAIKAKARLKEERDGESGFEALLGNTFYTGFQAPLQNGYTIQFAPIAAILAKGHTLALCLDKGGTGVIMTKRTHSDVEA